MGTQQLFWLGLAAGVLALLFALFQAKRVLSFSEGTDAMKKIASAIREGADAYLRHQYVPASTLPTRSAPTSAALVKMPPPTRANRAMELAPMPKVSMAAVMSLRGR